MTAYGKEYINLAGEFGFDKVVQKPVYMDEMGQLLHSYLGAEA